MNLQSVEPVRRTAWLLCVLAGTLAACVSVWIGGRKKLRAKTLLLFFPLAVPLGFLTARLALWLVSPDWYLFREADFWDFSSGGFMLYGAVGGVALAAWLAARFTGESAGKLLDAVAAPGMALVAVFRFSEGIIGMGYGRPMEEWFDPWGEYSYFPMEDPEPLLRFPFGIPDYYGDYHFSIFLLEGLAAAVFVFLLLRKKGNMPGSVFLLAVMLYAAAQTTLESLRVDHVMKWGFVRISQLISGVLAAGCLLLCAVRRKQQGGKMPFVVWIGFAACVGVILAMEFAAEKKILFLQWMRMDLCYFVMALASLAMLVLSARAWKKTFAAASR